MSDLEKINDLKKCAKEAAFHYLWKLIRMFLTMIGIIFLTTELVNFIAFMITGREVEVRLWIIILSCFVVIFTSSSTREYIRTNIAFIILNYVRYDFLKFIEGFDEDERHKHLEEFIKRECETALDHTK